MQKVLTNLCVWLFGLLLYLFGQLVFPNLDVYFSLLAGWLTLLLLLIKYISRLKFYQLELWSQFTGPALFLLSAGLFYLFLDTDLLRNIFNLLATVVLVVYLYNIWLFYQRSSKYQAFTLESVSWYLLILASFFISSSLYGFMIFVKFPFLLAILLLTIYIWLSYYSVSWFEKVSVKKFWLLFGFLILITLEVFASLRILPFSFFVLGFWWTGIWYFAQRTISDVIKLGKFSRQVLTFGVIFLFFGIILTSTTRFF